MGRAPLPLRAATAEPPSFGGASSLQGATDEAIALALCDRLFAEHLSALEERYGAHALGLADLPPLTGEAIEPYQLRVVPPLYWASEVENAGLLAVAEALSAGAVGGTFIEPIGDGIHLLVGFWRERNERFSPSERIAVYSHLFGGDGSPDPNTAFPSLFGGLVSALGAVGTAAPTDSTAYLAARVAELGTELAANLSMRTAGVAAFAAREIVDSIRKALAILQHPDIRAALGGGSPWVIVERASPRLLGRPIQPRPHLDRAQAGMRVLSWVSENAAALGTEPAAISRNDEVVRAALTWLNASGGP